MGEAFYLEIQTLLRFVNTTPIHQVSSSYVWSFRSYSVGKHTNKWTLMKTSTSCRCATLVENNHVNCSLLSYEHFRAIWKNSAAVTFYIINQRSSGWPL